MKSWSRVVTQLSIEMSGPLAFASLWAAVEWHTAAQLPLSQVASLFAIRFAGAAYVLNQVFRVVKQVRAEEGQERVQDKVQRVLADLDMVDKQVGKMIADLDAKTREVLGHVMGGDSYAYLVFNNKPIPTFSGAYVINVGAYPLHDLRIFLDDLDVQMGRIGAECLPSTLSGLTGTSSYDIGSLTPGGVCPGIKWDAPVGDLTARHFELSFFARNGRWRQQIQWRRLDEKWAFATRVKSNEGVTLFESIDETFPRCSDGSVLW